MNPYNKAHELAQALANCDECLKLKETRKLVDAEPAAKQMLENFHQKQMELMQSEAIGQAPSPAQMEQLQKLYEIISMNTVVRDYLSAEMRFSRLISDVQGILAQALDDLNPGGGQ